MAEDIIYPDKLKEIAIGEHDSDTTPTKKVLVYGWDGSNLVKVRLSVDSDGRIITGNILEKYVISDKDDDASPNYYGFVDKDGNWIILKETVSTGNDTYRYASGSANYTTNWTNRASLTYDYFYNVF